MMMLVSTQINGVDRKKKVTVDGPVNSGSVRKAIEAAFMCEGVGALSRLEMMDADFGEFVDVEPSTMLADKARLRAVFVQSAEDAEKDKIIEQLRTRLGQLEQNMRMVSARRSDGAERSETRSQRSACSDAIRRKKCEERLNNDSTPDDPLRAAVREEKLKMKKQEMAAEAYF